MKKILLSSVILLLVTMSIVPPSFAYLIKGVEKDIETREIEINGKDYVLLVDVCTANGIEWEWDSISRKITLRKNGNEAVFLVGSKYYSAGEKIKRLSAPVCMKGGTLYVPLKFAKYTIKRLFDLGKKTLTVEKALYEPKAKETKKPLQKRYKIEKVVIDPGHGGKDPGAIGRTGLKEKDIVLNVSRWIKEELEENGMDVIMTRDCDEFIPLGRRTKIANENNADLFISVHANANRARWLGGFEVYYLSEATDDNARALASSENSVLKYEEDSFVGHTKNLDAIVWDLMFTENREESIELAGFICQEVERRLELKGNKVRSARFYILKGAEMPAVLVELSYLSNKWDEKNLKKSYYRQKLAEGIVAGIMGYKYEYERMDGFSR